MSASMRSSAALWSLSVRIALTRISDLPNVDLIVFLVRPDEVHEDHRKLVVDPHDEPVVVALDVEHHAIADNARVAVLPLYVRWRPPVLLLHLPEPGEERSFGVRESVPE